MTSNLRKEQEEEARIIEKMQESKHQIDWNEQQIMILQQRLIDFERTQKEETTAQEMLNILSTDVRKNRELLMERYKKEISDKAYKLEEIDRILNEPLLNGAEFDALESDIRRMQREYKD